MQGTLVQALVKELRPYMLHGTAFKKRVLFNIKFLENNAFLPFLHSLNRCSLSASMERGWVLSVGKCCWPSMPFCKLDLGVSSPPPGRDSCLWRCLWRCPAARPFTLAALPGLETAED